MQVDQALVSLNSKAEMRLLISEISNNLKGWLKTQAAVRLADALSNAERIADEAFSQSQVNFYFLLYLIKYLIEVLIYI